jgi:hypothetical protein
MLEEFYEDSDNNWTNERIKNIWIISSLDEFTSLTFPISLDLKKDIDLAEFDDIKSNKDNIKLANFSFSNYYPSDTR